MKSSLTKFLAFSAVLTMFAFHTNTPWVTVAFAGCSDTAQPGVDWAKCKKRNVIISSTDLTDADLSSSDMAASDLRDTTLNGTNFTKAVLLRVSLSGSTAKNTNFEGIIASRLDFRDATIENSNFQKSEIARADFSGSTLKSIDFSKADLPRVNFADATLVDVTFENTNLARTDFSETTFEGSLNLKGTYLYLTNIQGHDLSKAAGLQQWQLDMACGDDETQIPDGLAKPVGWPCGSE